MSSWTWREVLAYHRSLKGIGQQSLLLDRGESGYENRFLPDGRILYMGEGLKGHQAPKGGNLRLLLAEKEGTPLRVFLRQGRNRWQDLGFYRVEGHTHALHQGRWVYWFTLRPCESGEAP